MIATPNRTAQLLIRYAAAAGLRPHTYLENGRPAYRGSVRVVLSGTGVDSPFGALFIGAASGRVIRGVLTFGNDGPTVRYTGARAVQAALRQLLPTRRPSRKDTT